MKPTEIWLTLDYADDYYLTFGGKPTKTYHKNYHFTDEQEGRLNMLVVGKGPKEAMKKGLGKGMRRNTSRRIA